MSQHRLAQLLGVAPSHVTQWVRGYSAPGLKYALLIEAATGFPATSWVPGLADDLRRVREQAGAL